ncbi:MAG: hypothetical protein KL787_06990 [Taibaiella sp.]|nr:hypothetical protein [Taibaiella sp.]
MLEWIQERKWRVFIATPVLLLFTYYNLWWTYQAHGGQGLSFGAPSTKTYYFNTALRYDVPADYMKMRDNPDYYKGDVSEEQITRKLYGTDQGIEEITVQGNQQQSLRFNIPDPVEDWFRASADFYTEQISGDLWNGPVFGIKIMERRPGCHVQYDPGYPVHAKWKKDYFEPGYEDQEQGFRCGRTGV